MTWPTHENAVLAVGQPISTSSSVSTLVELLAPANACPPQLLTLGRIMQASSQPMFVAWGGGLQLFYNDAYVPILGERHPAAFGQPMMQVWAEVAEQLQPLVTRTLAGESIHMDDIKLLLLRGVEGRRTRQEAHFSFSYTAIAGDRPGEVLGLFCACAETTDAVRQSQLREAESRRLAQVLDAMGEGFILLDEAFCLTEINAEGIKIDGRPVEQLLGQVHWDLWPASLGTPIESHFRRVMAERTPVQFQHHYVSASQDVYLDIRVYPVSGGIAAFYRDVTALAVASTAVQQSHDRFRAAMEAIGVMWTNTAEGRMIAPQPGWSALTGQSEAAYSGFGWADALHPEDVQATLDAWNEAVAGRHTFSFEHRVRRRDGAWRRFAIRAVPVFAPDGALREWVGVHIDITDAAAATDALRAADRRKDEFLAILAHELRNPLAPIRTAAELLGRPDLSPERLAWLGAVIARQSQAMAQLLEDLLDLSRFRSGSTALRPEAVTLMQLVEAAVETVQGALDAKQHRFTINLPAAPVLLHVDRLRTTQVLINLLTNAAKYTDAGGLIRLDARVMHDTAAARAELGHWLCLEVSDNGIGMARESLAEVFDMFMQVRGNRDRADGGLGIGLTLTKRMVELQGGRIEATSPGLGQGSSFRVSLPLGAGSS